MGHVKERQKFWIHSKTHSRLFCLREKAPMTRVNCSRNWVVIESSTLTPPGSQSWGWHLKVPQSGPRENLVSTRPHRMLVEELHNSRPFTYTNFSSLLISPRQTYAQEGSETAHQTEQRIRNRSSQWKQALAGAENKIWLYVLQVWSPGSYVAMDIF